MSKIFRIFISSTFSDFVEERNALQEHVFPRLRELYAEHGCRLQAVDLRWGVGVEAAGTTGPCASAKRNLPAARR